jgi:hypothetical protein
MAMAKTLIWMMALMMMFPLVMALDCQQNFGEFLPYRSLGYVCTDVQSEYCLGFVAYDNKTEGLISVTPKTEFTEIGFHNGFRVTNNVSLVEISTRDVRNDIPFIIGVRCGDEEWSHTRTTEWVSPNAPVRGVFWTKQNLAWLIGGFILLVVVVFLIWLVISRGD